MKRLSWDVVPGCVAVLDDARAAPLIMLRSPGPADRDALNAMLGRCSLASRYGRFLGPVRQFPAGHLEAVTSWRPDVEACIVALDDEAGRRVVALASLHQQGPDRAEVAVLVEDAWQDRGLGTRLLIRLRERARGRGIAVLHAVVLSEHTHVLRLLGAAFGAGRIEHDGVTTAVTIPLDDAAHRSPVFGLTVGAA